MAFSLAELGSSLAERGLSPFLDPSGTKMQVGTYGLTGKLRYGCSLAGAFWFLQTVDYAACPSDNPNLPAVLRVLADLNYHLNVLKFSWDARDGEIVGTVESLAPADNSPTEIAGSVFFEFVRGTDIQRWRIRQTIKTGTDPGRCSVENLAPIIDSLLADPEVPDGHKEWLREVKQSTSSDMTI